MYRIARLVALVVLCVLLAAIPVMGIIFWPAIASIAHPPRRTTIPPPVASAPLVQSPPTPLVTPEPAPPRKGSRTWAEVEAAFDGVRALRGEPGWTDELTATYS